MDDNLLSDREIEVLRLVGQGKSNKEIAIDLSISVNTVKVHIGRIFQKSMSPPAQKLHYMRSNVAWLSSLTWL